MKEGDIFIYLADPNCVDLEDESILDTTERSKANAFKFLKDRRLYVAAHIFLRQVLSRYALVAPASWQFTSNAYGKPAIANKGYEWLKFNLSHTHGLIACAVSYKRAVGIDVEKRKQLIDLESLCQYAFSTEEALDVLSFDSIQTQEQRFFTYWTLKEAYIKARGMGLSIPLQQFTFVEGENKEWTLHCAPTLDDLGRDWWFATYRCKQYHLSIGMQVDPDVKLATISNIRMCNGEIFDWSRECDRIGIS